MSNESDIAAPVTLVEDADTGHRFLIYATANGAQVELRYEGDALWMTRAQMAQLFGRDVSVVARHITNILEEGELEEESNVQFMHIARSTKPVSLYSLDMVISVGYRVSSAQATLFRKWATSVLVRFATRGFVVDVERLKAPGELDRVRELREIIRDIRASEANVYAELRRICAMCQDYEPNSPVALQFYQRTQAKLFYAVVNRTPSEVLGERADADAPDMGLRSWPKDQIRQADAVIAKNYLAPTELKELNRLTDILLSIFEDQLDIGRLVLMEQASQLLDQQLASLNRVVLNHGGSIRHDEAEARAKAEYRRFDEARRLARKEEADRALAQLKAADQALPKPRRR
ncbi:RhuM family protein [Caulobacter sp. BP25]|uniref:RhuM family protein n=1 Tax=Caulobacter sp. BP25 TaxID=2048900 RepID=UPI000C12B867|nr:RhuM family protein [Caulobacter sp. BP25]PHY19190.1 DNA-binding protein [Caulobacter sp. BP25]